MSSHRYATQGLHWRESSERCKAVAYPNKVAPELFDWFKEFLVAGYGIDQLWLLDGALAGRPNARRNLLPELQQLTHAGVYRNGHTLHESLHRFLDLHSLRCGQTIDESPQRTRVRELLGPPSQARGYRERLLLSAGLVELGRTIDAIPGSLIFAALDLSEKQIPSDRLLHLKPGFDRLAVAGRRFWPAAGFSDPSRPESSRERGMFAQRAVEITVNAAHLAEVIAKLHKHGLSRRFTGCSVYIPCFAEGFARIGGDSKSDTTLEPEACDALIDRAERGLDATLALVEAIESGRGVVRSSNRAPAMQVQQPPGI